MPQVPTGRAGMGSDQGKVTSHGTNHTSWNKLKHWLSSDTSRNTELPPKQWQGPHTNQEKVMVWRMLQKSSAMTQTDFL